MKTLVAIIAVAGLAATSPAYFENFTDWNLQTHTSGGNWYHTYDLGTSTLDTNGWTILGNSGTGVDLVGQGWNTTPPAPSLEWVDLAGTPGPGGIKNTFTGAGGTYNLSFAALSNDFIPYTTTTYGFTVILNGSATPLADYVGALNDTWQTENLSFTAGTTFTLAFYTNAPDNGNVGITNINLTPASATPEPITMGLGIAGIGLAVRRRMKAKARAAR